MTDLLALSALWANLGLQAAGYYRRIHRHQSKIKDEDKRFDLELTTTPTSRGYAA